MLPRFIQIVNALFYPSILTLNMIEVRCIKCGKLLLKAVIVVCEIKCKCGEVNKVKIVTQDIERDFTKAYKSSDG